MKAAFSFLRGLIFILWMYGLMVLMGIVFSPLLLGPARWTHKIVIIWIKLTLWGLRLFCGVRLHITGHENIPQGGMLIASKHQAMLDVLWPLLVFSNPALVFKKELMLMPIFGWYALKLGNIVVDRAGQATALRKMMHQAETLASAGRQIIIFPEGTRTSPGVTVPYKPGVAALYRAMNVPCVPVALNSGLHWPAHGLGFKPGLVTVQILPPIAPGLERKPFMKTLESQIETASADLLI